MGKLDDLMKSSRGIASESMGRPATAPMNGSSTPATPDRLQGVTRSKAAAEIPLAKIAPDPAQPREEFDAESLGRLAESMKARGQLQPIRVRWDDGTGHYVIVCGERRWRAAEQAGMSAISCVIMDGPITPGELLTIQVVENALREDLRPIEQAKAFRALMDLNGWSTHQVARELAVDQSTVVKTLALLALPQAVQEYVEQGNLSPSVAYEVGKLESADAQVKIAHQVVAEGLSRAETVEAVKHAAGRAKSKGRGTRKPTSRIFRKLAGCTVTVENGKGLNASIILAALLEATERIRREAAENHAAA
jgi:ParB family chromosome partitioning protein